MMLQRFCFYVVRYLWPGGRRGPWSKYCWLPRPFLGCASLAKAEADTVCGVLSTLCLGNLPGTRRPQRSGKFFTCLRSKVHDICMHLMYLLSNEHMHMYLELVNPRKEPGHRRNRVREPARRLRLPPSSPPYRPRLSPFVAFKLGFCCISCAMLRLQVTSAVTPHQLQLDGVGHYQLLPP